MTSPRTADKLDASSRPVGRGCLLAGSAGAGQPTPLLGRLGRIGRTFGSPLSAPRRTVSARPMERRKGCHRLAAKPGRTPTDRAEARASVGGHSRSRHSGSVGSRITLFVLPGRTDAYEQRNGVRVDEQYERLAALAAARGVSPRRSWPDSSTTPTRASMATRIRPEPSRSASAPITRKRTTAVSSGRSLPITSLLLTSTPRAVGRLQFSLRLPRTRSEGEPEHDDIKQATPARMISPESRRRTRWQRRRSPAV